MLTLLKQMVPYGPVNIKTKVKCMKSLPLVYYVYITDVKQIMVPYVVSKVFIHIYFLFGM